MDKIKKQALEAAGWKFGDAEDFLNEGRPMSEKAIHVRDKIKHAMLNWTELSNREITSYLLLLAEAIEELDKPPAIPPITRPATAEGGDWRL